MYGILYKQCVTSIYCVFQKWGQHSSRATPFNVSITNVSRWTTSATSITTVTTAKTSQRPRAVVSRTLGIHGEVRSWTTQWLWISNGDWIAQQTFLFACRCITRLNLYTVCHEWLFCLYALSLIFLYWHWTPDRLSPETSSTRLVYHSNNNFNLWRQSYTLRIAITMCSLKVRRPEPVIKDFVWRKKLYLSIADLAFGAVQPASTYVSTYVSLVSRCEGRYCFP